MKKVLGIAFLALVVAVPAMAANSLTVNGTAALEGSYGLSVNIDGANNTTDAYVVSDHPANETLYRFSFRLNPGTLSMDASGQARFFVIGNIRKPTPDKNFFFVYLMLGQDGWWHLQANARQDDGTFQPWQTTVKVCSVNAGASVPCSTFTNIQITYEWAAASAPGANDGYLKVYRDGGSTPIRTFSNMDNDTQSIESAWFGAIWMANNTQGAAANGSYYFDSFESYRSVQP